MQVKDADKIFNVYNKTVTETECPSYIYELDRVVCWRYAYFISLTILFIINLLYPIHDFQKAFILLCIMFIVSYGFLINFTFHYVTDKFKVPNPYLRINIFE